MVGLHLSVRLDADDLPFGNGCAGVGPGRRSGISSALALHKKCLNFQSAVRSQDLDKNDEVSHGSLLEKVGI